MHRTIVEILIRENFRYGLIIGLMIGIVITLLAFLGLIYFEVI